MAVRTIRMWDDEMLRKKWKSVAVVDDRIRQILEHLDGEIYLDKAIGEIEV